MVFLLGNNPQAYRDARAVEELVGHGDNALDQVCFDESCPDLALVVRLAGERAVGEHHAHAAGAVEVVHHVLDPGEVRVALGRDAVLPARVLLELVAAPVREVEGRVSEDEVELLRAVQVIEERIGVLLAQVRVDAPDGEVHGRHLPRGGVALLAVDRQVIDVALVALHEFGRLNEHAARAAAGIVDAPMVGLDDLDERPDNAGGRVELARVLALRLRELGEAVLVGASQDVARVALLRHLHVGEEVHDLAQAALVQLLAGEVLGEDVLELVVLRLDLAHGLVDDLAHLGGVRGGSNGLPAGALRHEEDVLRRILVAILLEALSLVDKLLVALVELVGDVLEKDEPKHDVLVLGGIDVAA